METLKKYLTFCRTKLENFMGSSNAEIPLITEKPKDLVILNPNDFQSQDEDLYLLYRFVNNMVMPNINIYEIVNSKSKKMPADETLINEISSQIKKIFNSNGYKFENIKILGPLNYYQCFRGKYIEKFYFSSDISHLGKKIGPMVIGIETFLREDETSDNKIVKFLSIINVELGKKMNPFNNLNETKMDKNIEINYVPDQNYQPSQAEIDALEQAKKMSVKLNDSFNNFAPRDDMDDLFIKPKNNVIGEQNYDVNSEDSLIPSNIEFSYEPPSITQTSNN
jgi:hypothetical protein